MARKTIENFIEKASLLYEQKRRAGSIASPLEMYVRRWIGWAEGGMANTETERRKTASRRSIFELKFVNDQAASAAFRFLRQPNRPNAPRPEAKSGSAAGTGVAAVAMIGDASMTAEARSPPAGCVKP